MNDLFYQLATKRITSEATAEEQKQLDELLQNPERQKEFAELEKAWQEAAALELDSFAQTDWIKMEQRLQVPKKAKLISSRTRFMMGIAASLLIMMAAGYWLMGPMSYTTIEATAGNKEVLLPDQSIVTLKEGSSIAYKSNFKNNRDVKLKGQAFFKVAKDKDHPFVISTAGSKTTVLGTSFDITEDKALQKVQIFVKEGKVKFEGNDSELILEKGMAAEFNQGSGKVANIDFGTGNKVNWQDQKLIFNNVPISKVLDDLSEYFGVEIQLENEALDCGYTGHFEQAKWQDLIEAIEDVFQSKFEKQSEKVWIMKGGSC